MSKKVRYSLSAGLTFVTLAAGAYYLFGHQNLLHQLARTPPITIILVLLLYIVMFGVLVLILLATLKLCDKKLSAQENVLLNIYSLFINFFVPGQGGPAYRGIYMRQRHGLKILKYTIATLLYYAIYAIISIIMLLAFSRPWWQTVLLVAIGGAVGFVVVKLYSRRAKFTVSRLELHWRDIGYVVAATVLQALVQIGIYFVELHSVNGAITFSQVVTYTGAANLALFVGLTPGAIGIRESFLVFTEHLHHVSSANIVVANFIDRSVYLIFLLILFILTITLHVKKRLQVEPAGTLNRPQKPKNL